MMMSPESRDDDRDPRESPAPDRDREQPRARTAKRGKTKSNPSATPTRGDSSETTEATRREAGGGSSTVERPPRTTKKATTRVTPKRERPGMPEDQHDELPPHGDALLTRVETPAPKPAKPSRPRAGGGGGGAAGGGGGRAAAPAALLPNPGDLGRLLAGEHAQPHDVLGAHTVTVAGTSGVVIRALMPNASGAEAVLEDGRVFPLDTMAAGLSNLYCGFVPGATLPVRYRLRFHFPDGAIWER